MDGSKKIVAFCPLPFMDAQIEIHKAFVYSLLILSKEYDITLIIDQKKRFTKYVEYGIIELIEDNGIRVEKIFNMLQSTGVKNEYKANYDWFDAETYDCDVLYIYSIPICNSKEILKCGFDRDVEVTKIPFMSNRTKHISFMIINKILREVHPKLVHMTVDYNEPLYSKYYEDTVDFALYKDEHFRSFYLYENYLFRKDRNTEKVYDFVFGYLVTFAARRYLSEIVYENVKENRKVKIYTNDRFWNGVGRNDIVPQDVYYEEVSKSKFSLVVPSTDVTRVSYIRILECFSVKCIPLILCSVRLESAFEEHRDIYKFFVDNGLIYDPENDGTVNEKLEKLNYEELVRKMENLKSIKMFKNKKEIRNKMLQSFNF